MFDICTAPVSLTKAETLESWNGLIRSFLAHGAEAPQHLGAVLQSEPGFAMGHAAKGLFSMMMGRRELVAVAIEAHEAAQAALAQGGATERERLWCQALADWINGSPSLAIARMEGCMALHPGDALSMKVGHAIRFILGDNKGMRASLERVMGAYGPDHPLRGYALGCLSFALEETGSYKEAERAGIEALEWAEDDAWGLHAVAHVYDMTHRPDCGIALIDQNGPAWGHCNNFRYHVWWHKALLHLDQGDLAHVLELYDTKIRHEKTDDYRDFSNASSLLMRLELEGMDVGDRWAELADLAETRSADGCLVFADMHYMLALAGDSREDAASRMIARVAQDAQAPGEMAQIMDNPGRAGAEGLAAFGEARWGDAFRLLSHAQPAFQTMGGSHAQRDVFERMTIEAGIRSGHLEGALSLLDQRTSVRAGATDAFAASRRKTIAEARALRDTVAAE